MNSASPFQISAGKEFGRQRMRSWFFKYAFLTWAVVFTAYSQANYDSPIKMKEAPAWQERQSALHHVLKRYPLSDTALQSGIAALFERESRDPNWSNLEEEIPYEGYYDEVSDLCQKIAETYHRHAAWHALVYSNYNEDSKFGLWLAAQPETFPLFFAMLNDSHSGLRDRAVVMLAEILQSCKNLKNTNCSTMFAKQNEIFSIIRQRIATPQGEGIGIEALGICGTRDDLGLLEKIAAQRRARKIDPADKGAVMEQQAALWLVRNAEKQIEARESSEVK